MLVHLPRSAVLIIHLEVYLDNQFLSNLNQLPLEDYLGPHSHLVHYLEQLEEVQFLILYLSHLSHLSQYLGVYLLINHNNLKTLVLMIKSLRLS